MDLTPRHNDFRGWLTSIWIAGSLNLRPNPL
jgi:hypothetical protein